VQLDTKIDHFTDTLHSQSQPLYGTEEIKAKATKAVCVSINRNIPKLDIKTKAGISHLNLQPGKASDLLVHSQQVIN